MPSTKNQKSRRSHIYLELLETRLQSKVFVGQLEISAVLRVHSSLAEGDGLPRALSVMPRMKKGKASAEVDPQQEAAAAMGSGSSHGTTHTESPAHQQPHAADRVSGWMMSALDEVQGAEKKCATIVLPHS